MRDLCWYDLIGKGLQGSGLQEETIETADGKVKRFTRPQDAAVATAAASAAAISTQRALPDWLRLPVSEQAPGDHVLRPSDAAGAPAAKPRPGESIEQRTRALQRGTLVHRLLQSLPELAAGRRSEAARKFLERNATAWGEAERHGLAEKVLTLIAEPRFAPVFAEGSRPEVAIVGRLELPDGKQALVSGQIDRLVVTPDEVLIVDFKTNHVPPATAAEAPPAYVRQLALYRAILRKLYPQASVRAALLWTETADLMEISGPALDAALASRERVDSPA